MLSHSETAFLIAIEPPLIAGDVPVVLARLRAGWSADRIADFLSSPLAAVVKAAATCLGFTGSMEHCTALVAVLGHADPQVASAAEDALWNIWMRAGTAQSVGRLRVAVRRLQEEQAEAALQLLEDLTASEETFAEAHHQRAIALHLLDRYEAAEQAYQQAIRLNPHHFAAIAGLGHACAQRGDFAAALRHYHHALDIHPRLSEIREVVPQIEAALQRRVVA